MGDPRSRQLLQLQQRYGNAAVQLKSRIVGGEGLMAALQDFAPPASATAPPQSREDQLPEQDGRPLTPDLQGSLQASAGTDLSDVRIFQGGRTETALESMEAEAATRGTNVYLRSGLDPATPRGRETLVHELRHVGQQRRGETEGLEGLGGDPEKREALERDADRT
jgi:hypothetical protein